MGAVWDYKVSPSEQIVLLALGDHADHNGENAWPSVALLAWKTGLTVRGVKGILRRLRDAGVIAKQRDPGFHRPTTYRIVLNTLPRKVPLEREKGEARAPIKGEAHDEKGAPECEKGEAMRSPKPSYLNRPTEPCNLENAKRDREARHAALIERRRGAVAAAR